MKPNAFTMQVLTMLAFIPALVILEFNHKKVTVQQKMAAVKIERVITLATPKTKAHITPVKGFPYGIVFLYY